MSTYLRLKNQNQEKNWVHADYCRQTHCIVPYYKFLVDYIFCESICYYPV